jgi:hypothetical protein
MRQTSRPLCSHGAESASNSELGAGIAPHIAQIAEVWIGDNGEPRIHEVWCALGGITLMPARAAGHWLPEARLANARNRLPIPTELHRLP